MPDRDSVVIKFAGDSGDGMQLTGTEFTQNTADFGNDFTTFPNYPAEIRAPAGTTYGVSGFQIHFGSAEVNTPGGAFDVLVAMNAAAFRESIHGLRPGGVLIANEPGFEGKNIKLAGYADDAVVLDDDVRDRFRVYTYDFTDLTRRCLEDSPLPLKQRDLAKNMYVLGFVYWIFHRDIDSTLDFLEAKFGDRPDVLDANVRALRAGYHLGETVEASVERYTVPPLHAERSARRTSHVNGSLACARGLIAGARLSGLQLYYASYPITPASPVLHGLSARPEVMDFQAEDEIAAIGAAIGASFGGALGVTGTSGPGMALKAESLNLAVMLELPLVVLNVQRAGPSTGMPTKVEQSDLLQALYGRNGESPLVVLAARSPADAYDTAIEACRLAVEHMTPVVMLSDGFIANSSEPWEEPDASSFDPIRPPFADPDADYVPYARDDRGVRRWAIPGTPGLEHRLGGLEKEEDTGNVSYDPENHQRMTDLRRRKVELVADAIPEAAVDQGDAAGDVLLVGWGSTYGALRSATRQLRAEGRSVSHLHLRHIAPFPHGLGELLGRFRQILVPELNDGQLVRILRERFLVDAVPVTKVMGIPFTTAEIVEAVNEHHA